MGAHGHEGAVEHDQDRATDEGMPLPEAVGQADGDQGDVDEDDEDDDLEDDDLGEDEDDDYDDQ